MTETVQVEKPKCPRCKKPLPENYEKKTCAECLEKIRTEYKAKMKAVRGFRPTKEDFEARKESERKEWLAYKTKYGSENFECVKWRPINDLKEKYGSVMKDEWIEFYLNHIESCASCRKWARQTKDDINAVGKSTEGFPELKAFQEAFRTEEPSNSGWNDITGQNDLDILQSLDKSEYEKGKKRRTIRKVENG